MSDRSIPQLTMEVVDAGLEYVKSEAALVQRNVSKTVAQKGAGVGLLLGAAMIALIGLVFLVIALFHALDSFLSPSVAALLTALAVFIVAGIVGFLGVGRLRGGD